MLRLRTIRDRFTEIAVAAKRGPFTYLGFIAELAVARCETGTSAAPAGSRPSPTPRLCVAIVGRLTFVGKIVEAGIVSHRLAHARKRRDA